MKRIFTVWTCWLIACFAFALPAVAVNYFRIEHPDNSKDGKAFPTWTEAITYLNEQPELEDGKAYKILVIQKKGAGADVQDNNNTVLMPNKAALISSTGWGSDKYELNVGKLLWAMQAPLTFDKVKLIGGNTYAEFQTIFANGHKVEFTPNVEVSGYLMLYGGASTNDVENTEIVLNGGKFYAVYGGGSNGHVTGTACIKVGGKVNCTFMYGGGANGGAKNTEVLIGDGANLSFQKLCGGSSYGSVEESLVRISGTAVLNLGSFRSNWGLYAAGSSSTSYTKTSRLEITGARQITEPYYLCGGSYEGSVDNTYVTVSGGSFKNTNDRYYTIITGGGYNGTVNEDTHVLVTGGENLGWIEGGNISNSGGVKGTAYVEIGEDCGQIVQVGGGNIGNYGGNIDVRIKGGEITKVYGSQTSYSNNVGTVIVSMEGGSAKYLYAVYARTVKEHFAITGKSEIHVSGGQVQNLGTIMKWSADMVPTVVDWDDELPVDIIVEGNNASIENFNAYCAENETDSKWTSFFKSSTLTFKDCGTYTLNSDLALFTEVVTENSTIDMGTHGFIVRKGVPLTISGETWQKPDGGFKLTSWVEDSEGTPPSVNDKIVILEGNDFGVDDFSFDDGEKELYKVGNSIRYNDGSLEDDDFHLVAITNEESEKGSLSVVWDGTVVNSGDKVPQIEGLPLIATVTPEEGYSGTVFVNDEPQTGSSVEIACDEDKTFKATFAENPYTITYTQPENGTITVTDAEDAVITTGSTALFNSLNTITVTPNTGYQLQEGSLKATYGDGNIRVELTPVEGQAGKYTFTMPAGAVTITATFEKATYQVTPSEVEGGSIEADKATAQMGDKVTLTYEANTNYEFVTWTVTDGSQQAVEVTAEEEGKYTFIMPASDVTVTAIFEKVNYQVQLKQTEGGTIKADKTTAQMGDKVTLMYEANTNYKFVAWTVTADGSQQAVEVKAGEEGKYTFTMPASDVTVTATFEKEEDPEPPVDPDPIRYYNIYVEDVCDGVEVSTSKQVVREGGSITVYVEKDTANYTFDNFKVYYKRSYYGGWDELKEGTQPGEYPIKNIWNHIYIKAEGAEEKEDPTGIESIEGVKVYTKDGSLYVQTPQREQVIIVSMSGAVVKNEEQVGLKQYHGLQPGIYIVRVGDRTYKLRLH